MSLLKLAPEIQKKLLGFEDQKMIKFFSEYRLRPLLSIMDPLNKIKEFNKIKRKSNRLFLPFSKGWIPGFFYFGFIYN